MTDSAKPAVGGPRGRGHARHGGARPPARERPRAAAARDALADYARGVYAKAAADNVFFMAGAIAFNVLVAFGPLLLVALGIAGTILRLQHTDPTDPLLEYIFDSLPPVSEEFQDAVGGILDQLVARSTGLLSIGTIFLVWLSTRLVGTLRTALREVFDIQQGRGIIEGKLFDIKMVLAAGTLLALNVGLTVSLQVIARFGLEALGFERGEPLPFQFLYGWIVAFLSIWAMFLLIYRYLPPRRIHWSTAIVAASFAAVLFELLKQAFGWYVTTIADYRSAYGNLATLVVLILWIYYTALVFILGGEVGQVFAMRRIRRRQRERLR
ncbi:MAG TPA: YihY/virulence factor BrkB family protein [Longimicrobiales bacterium]